MKRITNGFCYCILQRQHALESLKLTCSVFHLDAVHLCVLVVGAGREAAGYQGQLIPSHKGQVPLALKIFSKKILAL